MAGVGLPHKRFYFAWYGSYHKFPAYTRFFTCFRQKTYIWDWSGLFGGQGRELTLYQSTVAELSIECFPNTAQPQIPNVTPLDFFFWGRTKNLVNIDKIPRYEFQPPKTKDDHFCGCPRHGKRSITPIGCVPCYKRRTYWNILSCSNLDNTTFQNKIVI